MPPGCSILSTSSQRIREGGRNPCDGVEAAGVAAGRDLAGPKQQMQRRAVPGARAAWSTPRVAITQEGVG